MAPPLTTFFLENSIGSWMKTERFRDFDSALFSLHLFLRIPMEELTGYKSRGLTVWCSTSNYEDNPARLVGVLTPSFLVWVVTRSIVPWIRDKTYALLLSIYILMDIIIISLARSGLKHLRTIIIYLLTA